MELGRQVLGMEGPADAAYRIGGSGRCRRRMWVSSALLGHAMPLPSQQGKYILYIGTWSLWHLCEPLAIQVITGRGKPGWREVSLCRRASVGLLRLLQPLPYCDCCSLPSCRLSCC